MSIFPIPWTEALVGCRLSIENAERLAEDSRVLRTNGRLQTAYSVSLDAWEELGKAIILFRYYKTKVSVSEGDWYGVLREHKRKRVAWINSTDLLYGTNPPRSISELKDSLKKAIDEGDSKGWFNLEREVGVQVDWIGGNGRWRSPCTIDKAFFCTIPFGSDYWESNVLLIAPQLKSLLPP